MQFVNLVLPADPQCSQGLLPFPGLGTVGQGSKTVFRIKKKTKSWVQLQRT